MKISLAWLNEYVNVKEFFKNPTELSQLLTNAGLEVESITDSAKNFNHVVVGQIIELGRHPNAERLTLCQVDVGDGRHRQIVCGAKNHTQGDKVVVALPGAVLPKDFAIKLSKIRDVESQGMLCSETELGLIEKSDGIIILPKDAKIGVPYAEYLGLQDIVFEINVTPNRADCLSHIGLAREISCLLDSKLELPENKIKSGEKKVKDSVEVKLINSEMCPRYCGRLLSGVKIGSSPAWLKNRLQAVGLNTINNVVDITNFVMMEYGQPLHAFDANELRDNKIIIENAKPKEKFKTFDGTEIVLAGEELTIRDGKRAIALAGVIGELNSGVTEKTTDIFIEAAHFNPRGVRRSSRRHGIDTDSSHRFSRGTDPENVVEAMNRAISLIQELAGGIASRDHYDLYPNQIARKPIKVHRDILETRLGYKVELADFIKWMKRLHCKTKSTADTVTVEAPPFRVDLEIEMDLIEEYARLNGYDKIPETFPVLTTKPTDSARSFTNENKVAELIKNEGYLEARNHNFISSKWQSDLYSEKIFSELGLSSGGELPIDILNPLSEETGQMRQSLIPGLLTNLIYNYHRGTHFGRLFEVGFVFGKTANKYIESHRASLLTWGQNKGLWSKGDRPVIYDLKSTLEGSVRRLFGKIEWRKLNESQLPTFIHPGQAASIFYEGRVIGFIGALHPAFREEHKIRHDAAVAELDLSALMRGQPRFGRIGLISKFPAVERDLAFLTPLAIAAGDLLKEITKNGSPYLQSVEIFDVFRGQGVPDGYQSMAFRLILQDLENTLTEDKVTQVLNQICAALLSKFSIKRRV